MFTILLMIFLAIFNNYAQGEDAPTPDQYDDQVEQVTEEPGQDNTDTSELSETVDPFGHQEDNMEMPDESMPNQDMPGDEVPAEYLVPDADPAY